MWVALLWITFMVVAAIGQDMLIRHNWRGVTWKDVLDGRGFDDDEHAGGEA